MRGTWNHPVIYLGALLAGAVAFAVMSLRSVQHGTAVTSPSQPPTTDAFSFSNAAAPGPTAIDTDASQASEQPIVIAPLPPDATHVPDTDLLELSALVNLPNAEERHIDKEQWARVLPIAKRLAQGPCDCEQRNWLNHFIDMGQYAMAGADEAYYGQAALMRKMARNDTQLADDPGRIMR